MPILLDCILVQSLSEGRVLSYKFATQFHRISWIILTVSKGSNLLCNPPYLVLIGKNMNEKKFFMELLTLFSGYLRQFNTFTKLKRCSNKSPSQQLHVQN